MKRYEPTDQEAAAIFTKYKEGVKTRTLARQFGIDDGAMKRFLQRSGIDVQKDIDEARKEPNKISDLISKEVKDDFYVYLHKSKKDGTIFYVGKGRNDRAKALTYRSKAWEIAAADGYDIEYYAENLDESTALDVERTLIESLPNLVNVHTSKPVNFTAEEYKEYFAVNENSPSGLDRIAKTWTGNHLKGDIGPAGYVIEKYGKKYWKTKFKNKSVIVHRIIWTLVYGEIPANHIIDHIDGNSLNNNIENLRLIDQELNSRNRTKNKNNTTGVTGVSCCSDKGNKSYRAIVCVDNKKMTKRFSISKYGESEAFRLACNWRSTQIALLNDQGAGYTSRHGQ